MGKRNRETSSSSGRKKKKRGGAALPPNLLPPNLVKPPKTKTGVKRKLKLDEKPNKKSRRSKSNSGQTAQEFLHNDLFAPDSAAVKQVVKSRKTEHTSPVVLRRSTTPPSVHHNLSSVPSNTMATGSSSAYSLSNPASTSLLPSSKTFVPASTTTYIPRRRRSSDLLPQDPQPSPAKAKSAPVGRKVRSACRTCSQLLLILVLCFLAFPLFNSATPISIQKSLLRGRMEKWLVQSLRERKGHAECYRETLPQKFGFTHPEAYKKLNEYYKGYSEELVKEVFEELVQTEGNSIDNMQIYIKTSEPAIKSKECLDQENLEKRIQKRLVELLVVKSGEPCQRYEEDDAPRFKLKDVGEELYRKKFEAKGLAWDKFSHHLEVVNNNVQRYQLLSMKMSDPELRVAGQDIWTTAPPTFTAACHLNFWLLSMAPYFMAVAVLVLTVMYVLASFRRKSQLERDTEESFKEVVRFLENKNRTIVQWTPVSDIEALCQPQGMSAGEWKVVWPEVQKQVAKTRWIVKGNPGKPCWKFGPNAEHYIEKLGI